MLGTRDRLTQAEGEEEDGEGTSTEGSGSLMFEPGKNPIPVLQKYLETNPEPQVLVQEIQAAAARVHWTDTQTLKALFASLFDSSIKTNFYKKCDTLALFVQGPKQEKIVLLGLVKLLEKEVQLLSDLTHILNGFYSEGILSEDTLSKWYEQSVCRNAKGETDVVKKAAAQALKEACTPFIEWLKNAESESDEDY